MIDTVPLSTIRQNRPVEAATHSHRPTQTQTQTHAHTHTHLGDGTPTGPLLRHILLQSEKRRRAEKSSGVVKQVKQEDNRASVAGQ